MSAARLSSPFAPAPMPITTMRPPVASALRLSPRLGAPTSSRITSKGPCSAKPSESIAVAPEALDLGAGLLAAHRRGHLCAAGAAQLDRCGAHSPGPAVHQQALARLEAGLGEEGVVGGGEHLGEASGRGPVEAVGERHRATFVHHAELGLAPAAHDGGDPVALGEALGLGPARQDLAGQLQPGDVLGGAGRGGIAAAPLQQVGPVYPCTMHPDEHLAGARLGIRPLGHAELLVLDDHRSHRRGTLSRRYAA